MAVLVTPTPQFEGKWKSQFSTKKCEKNPDPPVAKFNIAIFGCPMVGPFQKYDLDTWSIPQIKSLLALGL